MVLLGDDSTVEDRASVSCSFFSSREDGRGARGIDSGVSS